MIRVLLDDLWPELAKLARGSGVKMAAVAYASSDAALQFGDGDTLIVDASDPVIKAGQTSALLLQAAFSRGAKLFSLPGLHAKVFVFDNIAVVGSANISANSHKLYEAGIVSDHASVLSDAVEIIDALRSQATPIDELFLARALDLPVTPRPWAGTRASSKRVTAHQHRTWLIGMPEDPEFPGDSALEDQRSKAASKRAKAGFASTWFWWKGKSHFRRNVRVGDRIIPLWRAKAESTSTRSVTVYPRYLVTAIYDELGVDEFTVHYLYDDSKGIPYSRFLKALADCGWNKSLSIDTCRELPTNIDLKLGDFWLR
jgi:hypothetical protein